MKQIHKITVFLTVFALIMSIPVAVFATPDTPVNDATHINGTILIDNKPIQAPAPYVHSQKDNSIMVPLRSIAEALGISVVWHTGTRSVTIDENVELRIGQTQFEASGIPAGILDPPPEISDNHTFVPLDFFNYIINGFVATVEDGCITIDTLPYFVYRELHNVFHASFIENVDESTLDHDISPSDFYVGADDEDNDIFSFLHLPFGADFMPHEISQAMLRLKVSDGAPPSSVMVGFIKDVWTGDTTTLAEATALIDRESIVPVTVNYDSGWISLDVTEFVTVWMAGERQNNGFALFPAPGEPTVSFISGNTESLEIPYLTIAGTVSDRLTGYSPFSYTRITPAQGLALHSLEDSNCMAYALRDLGFIGMYELGVTYDDMNSAFYESGIDGLLKYMTGLMETYVETNAAALQISSFRRIGSFDSPIDPGEYRIAMRIGAHPIGDFPLTFRNFDYHFWSQIDDGRWSQKFPRSVSEIIPGTAHNLDPADYNWRLGSWSSPDAHYFYNSSVVYFAVTKTTADFTDHKD